MKEPKYSDFENETFDVSSHKSTQQSPLIHTGLHHDSLMQTGRSTGRLGVKHSPGLPVMG